MGSKIKSKDDDCNFAHLPEVPLTEPNDKASLMLLPPEHPLLEKFQKSLKVHLSQTKVQLENEIEEIRYKVKVKEQAREAQGLMLYDMQQKIIFQRDQIKEISAQIEENVNNRQSEETVVSILKSEYEEKSKATKDKKNLYSKRMVELEHLQTLVKNIRKWATDVEDDVKNAKRIVSRDAQLQKQLSEEKRKSDVLFFHLDMEVKKREAELEGITKEHATMVDVLNIINMSISDANTDLEALQNEHKRLNQAWGEVIVAIQLRDKMLYQVIKMIRKEKENIKLSKSGIEAVKRQLNKEMDLNKKLENFKTRLAEDLISLQRECQREMDALNALEVQLNEFPLWLDQTEKDLREATKEGYSLGNQIRTIQFKLDKQYQKKFFLEDSILKIAQEQLITDKANEYRLKLLHKSQEHRRTMELSLSQSQNQLADTLLEMERLKGQLYKVSRENEHLKATLAAEEEKADHIDYELKHMQTQIEIKMKMFDKVNKDIDDANKIFESNVLSTTELKIKQIEKALHGAEQQIRELQQFWIMLQNHFVNLSQKRNQQMNEIQVNRKQLSIIKQKSLKIDTDLEKSNTTRNELTLEIQRYTSKIELLNDKIFKRRQHHENQESDCEFQHLEVMQKLKDNEMQILKLESEINDLMTDIELHKDLVLDHHREALSWETKFKLIEETIRWSKGEQKLSSEVGAMKTEIHRMTIRFNYLKRAQEKLLQDLEHCVMHREHIFVAATVKQHVETNPFKHKTASVNQTKLTELKNRLKIVLGDIQELTDVTLVEAIRDHERLVHILKRFKEDLDVENTEDKSIRHQINESILLKHSNLEKIIRKQYRARAYRKLSNDKIPLKILKSETTFQTLTQKQSDMNDILIEIIEKLTKDFPEKKTVFIKLSQILKD